MARINIEECWWSDPRRSKLSKILGDEDRADAAAVRMWRLAQEFWGKGRSLIPMKVWETVEAGPKLIEANLAELHEGGVYVSGSSQYLDWVCEKRAAGRAGGLKSAESRRAKSGSAQPIPTKTPKQTRSKVKQTQPSGSGSGSGSVSFSVSDSGTDSESTSYEQKTKSFIAGYCERFKFKYGTNPEMQGKPAGLAKTISKGLSADKMDLYLDAFFAMPDAGLVKAKHPLSLFQLKLNEIVVFANTGSFTTQRQAHQADDMASNQLLLEKIRRNAV